MRHSFLAVQKKYDEKDKTSQHCSNKIIASFLIVLRQIQIVGNFNNRSRCKVAEKINRIPI